MFKKNMWTIKMILFFIPLVFGVTGYLFAGLNVLDSIYSTIVLYGMDPVSDEINMWIEIARWTAPFATATVIFTVFRSVWNYLSWRLGSLFHDSVAVYTDLDIKIKFGKKVREIYSDEIRNSASSHIILFDDDEKNFNFYEKNRKALENKRVYIGLKEMDMGLMKADTDSVSYFDISGSISRLLWKKIALWNSSTDKQKNIVIWGNGSIAEKLLFSGLLLNLYSLQQHIRYVMAGDDIFHIKHPELQLMNDDEIVFLPKNIEDLVGELKNADILIIAEDVSVTLFQILLVAGRNADIYYYSHYRKSIDDAITAKSVMPFGLDQDIYSDGFIRQERLIKNAKELNKKYAKAEDADEEWKKLSGFLKWSNISAADYMDVLEDIIRNDPNYDIERLAELEHIRWCRFHFMNYWSYGIPDNGQAKDIKHRIHSCLKPYGELSEEDKEKDRDVVREIEIREEM